MKKLNTINKIYVTILVVLVIATAVKILRYKSWDRFYYAASFSSPHSYPVHVRNGFFILEDGDTKYVGTSDVNDNRNIGWGDGDYSNPSTSERLPVKLILEYASYRDESFYADTIDLPLDVIKKAFASVNTRGMSVSLYQAMPVYKLDFVVGIANKGNIIVWLRGEGFETTLLKHKIVPHPPVGDDTYYQRRLSKKQYFKEVFYIDSADRAAYQMGFDKGANYIDTPSQFKVRLKWDK
ncbi:DUF2931 family protein [Pedobacter sp. AW31-3R]|uniref:DUF2931 family protein n=1 Tax=Pedobacter sp. AW31-3R TaxID=3445781 RepID=UPI003FA0F860